MKKVVALALLAVVMISCQSTKNKTVSTTDSTSTVIDSVSVQDTLTVDSVN